MPVGNTYKKRVPCTFEVGMIARFVCFAPSLRDCGLGIDPNKN